MLYQPAVDPIEWLLEDDQANPGVRYFALTDLLDQPADAPQVVRARQAVMAHGPVPEILAAQDEEGWWVKPGGGYSPKYRGTIWQILWLAELGADPADERVQRGCEYVLGHSIAGNAAFSAHSKPVPSGSVHCLNGNLLSAFQRLDRGDDPRVQSALEWQASAVTGEDEFEYLKSGTSGPTFACGVNGGQPCAWGANKAMRALLAVPDDRRTPPIRRAIRVGAEFLLSRDPAIADYPYTERVSSTWFKLGFPLSYWSDVLETAAVLARSGLAKRGQLDNVTELLLSKQNAEGRWRLENSLNGKMWADIERRGKASKWVTLRALRYLKTLGRYSPATQGNSAD